MYQLYNKAWESYKRVNQKSIAIINQTSGEKSVKILVELDSNFSFSQLEAEQIVQDNRLPVLAYRQVRITSIETKFETLAKRRKTFVIDSTQTLHSYYLLTRLKIFYVSFQTSP